MSAFSDDFEQKLADHTVANYHYVVPFHIRLTGSNDGTYNVTVYSLTDGSTQFSTDVTGADQSTILDNLETKIDGGSQPVNAHTYTDVNGNETLMVEQDSTETLMFCRVDPGSNASGMTKNQEVFGALYFDDPSDSDSGLEVGDSSVTHNSGYTREPIAFNDATSPGGLIDNTSDVTFGPAGSEGWDDGGNEDITHVGLRDAPFPPNQGDYNNSDASDWLLYHGALSSPKTITQNDSFVFRAGDLDISLD